MRPSLLLWSASVFVCIIASQTNKVAAQMESEAAGATPARAVYIRPSEVRFTHENVRFEDPPNVRETMGLSSLALDLHFDNGFSAGPAAYAATSGKRGGFIGIGMNLGYRFFPANTWSLGPMIFLGAAGGVVTPVGEGLMLRPSFVIGHDWGRLATGLGYAWTKFPKGGFHSDGIFGQISLKSSFLYMDDSFTIAGDLPPGNLLRDDIPWVSRRWRVAPSFRMYFPKATSVDLTGQSYGKNIQLGGIGIERYLDERWFMSLEAFGAFTQGTGGYMSLTSGLGYAYPITEDFSIGPKLNLGASGGHNADTGGGLILEPSAQAVYRFTRFNSIHICGGYIYSLDGNFRFPTAGIGFSGEFSGLDTTQETSRLVAARLPSDVDPVDWRFSLSSQKYLLAGLSDPQTNRPLRDQDLLGLVLDYRIDEYLFLSAGAYWPYLGDAAGYAAGLFGMTIRLPLVDRLALELQAKGGPAAGAGLPTGDGILFLAMVGPDIRISQRISVFASAGIMGFKGSINSDILEFGLRYWFGIPAYWW